MSKIVAIRSLQCPDHAYNIPPKVLSVTWNITKRCNYDCSYCSPFIHDAVSPFVNFDNVTNLLNSCQEWCGDNKQIKWTITGGEPFIDPNFIKILELLRSKSFTYQINTISNGSLPTKLYLDAAKFVDGLTFSLHLERNDDEINKTIDTIISVNNQTNILVSVNLMFLPGQSNKIQEIVNKFNEHQVSYIVRLITPVDTEANNFKPYTNNTSRKDVVLKLPKDQQTERQKFVNKNQQQAIINIQQYYNDEELALIETLNTQPKWKNSGVWFEDGGYQEINTDQLVSTLQNNFKGWICYAGVDNIYIDWDGSIFKGLCLNDGPIGHIKDNKFIANTINSTICQLDRCPCNTDIAIRKAINTNYLKLITK